LLLALALLAPALPAGAEVLRGEPVTLDVVPRAPLARDRHTTLLAHFNSAADSDADYARAHAEDVGLSSDPAAPGRFGGGVAVTGANGYVMYAGLDNFTPLQGTGEFWARSRAASPIWKDGKSHWLFVAYPERAEFSAAEGMAPYHLGLYKSTDNHLVFHALQRSVARYALGVQLGSTNGWAVRVPVEQLAASEWHHVLFSYDLRPPGRLWLLVDGKGTTAPMGLRPDAPAPSPGYQLMFGGLSGLPGDDVRNAECDLDDLRLQAVTVAGRLPRQSPTGPHGDEGRGRSVTVDEKALLEREDMVRATVDKMLSLQRHGGWHDFYQWPTYEPSEWGSFGRGVNLWFTTNGDMGNLLLRAWRVWGDDRYLDAALDLARMLQETQFPIGGWNYYYAYTRGKFIPRSDHAYIAQQMQSNPIRFLTFLAGLTGDKGARETIRKAADFHLQAQGPGGWWGWEAYPMNSKKGPYGHPALNDAVTPQAMADLFVMYWLLRDPRCVEAIYRGAAWILAAQLGPPTYGWADQYDERNNPVWMRNFEPPAVSMQAVGSVIPALTMLYDITGSDHYLQPLQNCLTWLDSVPEKDRGWLWYDPKTQRPVVAYDNEMLPVDHPKAIQTIIPRLADHYGVKYPWPADRIRAALQARKNGPLYPAYAGWKPRTEVARERPERIPEEFRFARRERQIGSLRDWLAGKPAEELVGSNRDHGKQFDPMRAIRLAAALMDEIERARVALGDLPADRLPRYDPGVWGAWVYAFPKQDLYDLPRPAALSSVRRAASHDTETAARQSRLHP
jgi:hypothetical protein